MQAVQFDDFDACATALRSWDLEAVQLDRGSFWGELIQTCSATTLVAEGTFGRKLHQTGEPPRGLRTIVVPADPGQQIEWRDHSVTGDQLMLFPAGCELDAVSRAGFHVFTISFSEDRISDLTRSLADSDYEALAKGFEVLEPSPALMRELRRAARRFVTSLPDSEAARDSSEPVEANLMETLVEALDFAAPSPAVAPHRNRDRAVHRTLELIEAHEREALSVADLCRVAGVCRRTLEYAYQERFGLSPKAYLMARRLDGVRSDLKRAADDLSVTRAANRWGFHHLSQFAALYRRQFGERPRETLRHTAFLC